MKSKIHLHKVTAILGVKLRAMMSGNMIVMPILIVGLAAVLRMVYKNLGGGELSGFASGYILTYGLTFNIGGTGIFLSSAILAEEKEKNTLRVLMTSSVNGAEFFLASILPVFLEMMIINIAVLAVCGIPLETVNLPLFLFITAAASLIGCVLGMLLGIFSKNQMAANTLSTPLLLVVAIIPSFSSMIPALKKVCDYLFTGIVAQMAETYAAGEAYRLKPFSGIVLALTAAAACGLFLGCYRKYGYERE